VKNKFKTFLIYHYIYLIGVKTDLFKSQENTPVKEDMSKNFDALQVTVKLVTKSKLCCYECN
jgi:hypothetical protein